MLSSSPSLQPEGEKWTFNNVWKRFWFSVGEEKYWIQHHSQHLKTFKNNILHVSMCTCVFVSQTCAFILHQTSLFLLVVLVRSIVVCVCVHMCVRVPVRMCVAVAGNTMWLKKTVCSPSALSGSDAVCVCLHTFFFLCVHLHACVSVSEEARYALRRKWESAGRKFYCWEKKLKAYI